MTRYDIHIDAKRCKGCELCLNVCSPHFLTMSTSFNAMGVHFPEGVPGNDCIGCRQCALICPEAAIEIEKINDKTEKTGGITRAHDGQRSGG